MSDTENGVVCFGLIDMIRRRLRRKEEEEKKGEGEIRKPRCFFFFSPFAKYSGVTLTPILLDVHVTE